MSVKVELSFDTIEQMTKFFAVWERGLATFDPTPQIAAAQVTQLHAPAQTAVVQTQPSQTAADPIVAARTAMTEMMSRFPSGQGALKTREILSKHGLKRVADAKPEQALALIAEFQAAQPAAT
jgi:hypothetical protein